MNVFYEQLASWWPLISPLEEYTGEGQEVARVLAERRPGARTLLELGSGGGHVAFWLKQRLALTLTDLSPAMLEVSRRLNPECEHLVGDMRTLDLGRTFDLVLAHDALDYMKTEADLGGALATAWRHLGPGGLALFVPDQVQETYEPSTDCGGSDGPDGRAVRYLEWSTAVPPSATSGTTHYSFLVREADGSVRSLHEQHEFGLFPRATWERLLERCGFQVEVVEERTEEERTPRLLFLGHRPPATAPDGG